MTALFPKAAGQQRCQISPLPFRRQPSRGPGGADQPAAIFLGGTDPARQPQRQPVGRNPVACPPAKARCLGLGQPLHRPRPNHRHTFSESADIESQVREVGRQRAFDRAPGWCVDQPSRHSLHATWQQMALLFLCIRQEPQVLGLLIRIVRT